jgi:hypothetical protein
LRWPVSNCLTRVAVRTPADCNSSVDREPDGIARTAAVPSRSGGAGGEHCLDHLADRSRRDAGAVPPDVPATVASSHRSVGPPRHLSYLAAGHALPCAGGFGPSPGLGAGRVNT